MELTREQIESCKQRDNLFGPHIVHALCEQLLAEMDKPGLWKDAPEWADTAIIEFSENGKYPFCKSYTRTLPKSRIDEIAEDVAIEEAKKYGWSFAGIQSAIDIAKSAILKDREEGSR